MPSNSREVKTVGHATKIRVLEVKSVQMLAPRLKKIILSGPDLEGFVTMSPDDHIKAFFSPGESEPVVPSMGPNGMQVPEGKTPPVMRDYTPKHYDAKNNELELIFFLHDSGAAADWARSAKLGSKLVIGGPRGSRIVPYAFDWYLMIGDETAIPSFSRRLEEMPADATGHLILEVEDKSSEVKLTRPKGIQLHWVHRGDHSSADPIRIQKTLESLAFPEGDYFAWVIGESMAAKSTAELLIQTKAARKEWMKVTGYWDA